MQFKDYYQILGVEPSAGTGQVPVQVVPMEELEGVLESSNKEPIFLCHHCGKTFSRTAVAQAHRLRVARERQAGRTS